MLIDALRARQGRRAALARLVGEGYALGTAAINIAEVYAGMRPGEESATESFLSSLECYPMNGTIARRAGSLKSAFARQGQTIALADMVVAATALEHGLTLVTENSRDFPISELQLLSLPER